MKRKLITLLTCSLLFLNCVIPIQAKANLSALQNGTFNTLSEADKQQTTVALVNKISSELGIVHTPRTHFFVWPNSSFAAYTYFNKDVSELTIAECAMIAGITQSPEYYNPHYYPERAKESSFSCFCPQTIAEEKSIISQIKMRILNLFIFRKGKTGR